MLCHLNKQRLGVQPSQTNPFLHLQWFGLMSELTSRAELWASSRELSPHKELSTISMDVRARKTEGQDGDIS
jgi:hypothetical protein